MPTTDAQTQGATPNPASPLRSRSVLLWLLGQGISLLGDQIFFVAMAWTVAQVSDATTAGLILAAGALPRAVLMLGGGVLVDRLGPRKSVIGSDAVRLVVMLGAAAYLAISQPRVEILLAVAVIFGVAEALFHPGMAALPPRLAPPEQLVQMQGFRALLNRSASVIGAPLGGFLVVASGPALAFFINAMTFVVSIASLASMRLLPVPADAQATTTEPQESTGAVRRFGRELSDGLRYAVKHPRLLHVLVVTLLIEFGFTGAFNVALPLAAQARHWQATELGYVIGALSLGAACAALVTAFKKGLPLGGWTIIAGGAVQALCIAWIGFTTRSIHAVPAAFVIGVSSGLMTTTIFVLLQTSAPTEMLGRAMSLMGLVSYGTRPVAYALAGVVTDVGGSVAAFGLSAVISLGAALLGLGSKALRTARIP